MTCEFCGAELTPWTVQANGVRRIIMICPKDYVVKHTPMIYVPQQSE